MSVITLNYSDNPGTPDQWNDDTTGTLRRFAFTYDVAPAPIVTVIQRDAGQVTIPSTAMLTSYAASYSVVGVDGGQGTGSAQLWAGGVAVGAASISIPAGGSDDFQPVNVTLNSPAPSIAQVNSGQLGLQNYNTGSAYPARVRWRIRQGTNPGATKYLTATVTFTLAAPTVTTGAATAITTTTATLNATVDAQGANSDYPVTVHFEWGLTAAYGNSTPNQTLTGSGNRAVSAAISGLTAGTVYHFRVVAVNADNTVNGADANFTTQGASAGGTGIRSSNISPRRRF